MTEYTKDKLTKVLKFLHGDITSQDELTEMLNRMEEMGIVHAKYDAKTGELIYSLTQRGKNNLIYPEE